MPLVTLFLPSLGLSLRSRPCRIDDGRGEVQGSGGGQAHRFALLRGEVGEGRGDRGLVHGRGRCSGRLRGGGWGAASVDVEGEVLEGLAAAALLDVGEL